MRLKSKYDSIICISSDIPCYYATKTKKTNQITECGNKASPSKFHRRMDSSIIAWNDISFETIRMSFKSCALTTALDGDEDVQIQRFKPEENPFVAIFVDIAKVTPTKMLILTRT